MKRLRHLTVAIFAFILPIAMFGTLGYFSSMPIIMSLPRDMTIPPGTNAARVKIHDPAKPTVAIVLGDELTENTDVLNPYDIFSASEAYNVYAVALEHKLATLTDGLDIVPDYSLVELDTLLGKAPDIIVLPAMTSIQSQPNQRLLNWIRQQAGHGAFIFSICTGAEVFAASGLLDGRAATTHWGDIDRLQQQYPAVQWTRGVRYVEGAGYMTSAGITSGIDAALHLIAKRNGESLAQAIAQKMYYPSYAYVDKPQVQQITIEPSMSVYALNVLFHWDHANAGVLLYDGVGELDLASVFDTYAASFTTQLYSVASTRRLITTQHGLQLVPRWDFSTLPAVDRLLVAGKAAPQLAATELKDWALKPNAAKVVYIHTDTPNQFSFDAPLRDLAQQQNIPTAVMAAKYLEYRPGFTQIDGAGWPIWLIIRPLLLGLASVLILAAYRRSRKKPSVGQPA